jgi:hypothetical protein
LFIFLSLVRSLDEKYFRKKQNRRQQKTSAISLQTFVSVKNRAIPKDGKYVFCIRVAPVIRRAVCAAQIARAGNRQVFWLIACVSLKTQLLAPSQNLIQWHQPKASANYSNGLAWDSHPTSMTCIQYSI